MVRRDRAGTLDKRRIQSLTPDFADSFSAALTLDSLRLWLASHFLYCALLFSMTRSRLISLLFVVGAVIALIMFVKKDVVFKEYFGDETYKLFLQFCLITVVGGLVSTVFGELKHEQELRETRRESIRQFHGKALCAYNRAKKVRRLLPVKAFVGDPDRPVVVMANYREMMIELEDVQLEFESMKREVGIAKNLFSNVQNLEKSLNEMEKYLCAVLHEFERTRFSANNDKVHISELPRLSDFVGERFVADFSAPYDKVEAAFLRLILR